MPVRIAPRVYVMNINNACQPEQACLGWFFFFFPFLFFSLGALRQEPILYYYYHGDSSVHYNIRARAADISQRSAILRNDQHADCHRTSRARDLIIILYYYSYFRIEHITRGSYILVFLCFRPVIVMLFFATILCIVTSLPASMNKPLVDPGESV